MTPTKRHTGNLEYFAAEIGGRRYGGWYRLCGDSTVEVLARGRIYRVPLGDSSPEERARHVLEQMLAPREREDWRRQG